MEVNQAKDTKRKKRKFKIYFQDGSSQAMQLFLEW